MPSTILFDSLLGKFDAEFTELNYQAELARPRIDVLQTLTDLETSLKNQSYHPSKGQIILSALTIPARDPRFTDEVSQKLAILIPLAEKVDRYLRDGLLRIRVQSGHFNKKSKPPVVE